MEGYVCGGEGRGRVCGEAYGQCVEGNVWRGRGREDGREGESERDEMPREKGMRGIVYIMRDRVSLCWRLGVAKEESEGEEGKGVDGEGGGVRREVRNGQGGGMQRKDDRMRWSWFTYF